MAPKPKAVKKKARKPDKKHVFTKKTNWKNNTWRPSKYKKEYCEGIIEYFETCKAEILVDVSFFMPNKNIVVSDILNPLADKEDEETLQAGSVKKIDQKVVMNLFPTFIRYARSIGVNKTTLYEWADTHEDFSNAMEVCKSIAESILLENGLQWTYNSAFAMFLLKNNHWYKDKVEVDNKNVNIEVWITPEQEQKLLDRLQLDEQY